MSALPQRRTGGPARSALIVQLVVGLLRGIGVDMDRVLAELDFQPEALGPRARVDIKLVYRMWDEAVRVSGDEALGVRIAELVQIEELGMVGYCIKTSNDIREIIERTRRYSKVLSDAWDWDVQEHDGVCTVTLERVAGIERHPQVSVAVIGAVGSMGRRVLQQELQAREVRFRHAAPSPAAAATIAAAFGAPVKYEQPDDALVFDRSYLDLHVPSRDERLCKLLEEQVEQMLREVPEGDVLHDVMQAIAQALHAGHVDSDTVASRLAMSPRSLRRRLHAAGTTFQKLVDEVRFTLAKRYLRSTDMDASEIACELGYNNVSTFGRAFRRWSGMSAVEFRRSGA